MTKGRLPNLVVIPTLSQSPAHRNGLARPPQPPPTKHFHSYVTPWLSASTRLIRADNTLQTQWHSSDCVNGLHLHVFFFCSTPTITRLTWLIDCQALVAIPDCRLDYDLPCCKGSGFRYQVYVPVVHTTLSFPAHPLPSFLPFAFSTRMAYRPP